MNLHRNFMIGFDSSSNEFSITMEFKRKDWESLNKMTYFYSLDLLFLRKIYDGKQTLNELSLEETFQKVKEENAQVFLQYVQMISVLKPFIKNGFQSLTIINYSEHPDSKHVSFYLNGDHDTTFYYSYDFLTEHEAISSFKRDWKTCEYGIGDHYNLSERFFPFDHLIFHHIKKVDPKTRLKFLGN